MSNKHKTTTPFCEYNHRWLCCQILWLKPMDCAVITSIAEFMVSMIRGFESILYKGQPQTLYTVTYKNHTLPYDGKEDDAMGIEIYVPAYRKLLVERLREHLRQTFATDDCEINYYRGLGISVGTGHQRGYHRNVNDNTNMVFFDEELKERETVIPKYV